MLRGFRFGNNHDHIIDGDFRTTGARTHESHATQPEQDVLAYSNGSLLGSG